MLSRNKEWVKNIFLRIDEHHTLIVVANEVGGVKRQKDGVGGDDMVILNVLVSVKRYVYSSLKTVGQVLQYQIT